METYLCDELLHEIFHRLPPSSTAVSLVSKRWLRLFRSSLTTLSLQLHPHHHHSLPSFLSQHPYLSSLSLTTTTASADNILLSVAAADNLLLSLAAACPKLKHLHFFTGPVSLFPLLFLSSSCNYLTTLTVTLSRPISLHFLTSFPSLQTLTLNLVDGGHGESDGDILSAELRIESLGLSGIKSGDFGLRYLWTNCRLLRKIQLSSCEDLGDYTSFAECLRGVRQVELRTCRPVVGAVLACLARNCEFLESLLVYDGGSRDGLLHFVSESRCDLRRLDLRLPLDLDDNHLFAVAANFRGLRTLRLQSCCLVTGESLKALAMAVSDNLEELGLVNCDVIGKESGLLTMLGQVLRKLRKLDLSHNDMLRDKEFVSMMSSCDGLRELSLRGCGRLTNASCAAMVRNCKHLENVDMMNCGGVGSDAVEYFVIFSARLKKLRIEEDKLSDFTRKWMDNKRIEMVLS